MSVLLYGPNQVRINFADGNHFVAHLQAATHRRFADERGYFLTMAGDSDDHQKVCVSYWMHPSIPLLFLYDTEDVTGEPPETINIDDENVRALVDAMDRPLGILWGFSVEEGRYLPFADAPPPANEDD